MAKTHTTNSGPWRMAWRRSGGAKDGIIEVDVFDDLSGELVLEWSYPKVPGHSSLEALAAFWGPQARLEAESRWWKNRGSKFQVGDPVLVRDLDRWLPNFEVGKVIGASRVVAMYPHGEGPVAARIAGTEVPSLVGSTRFDYDGWHKRRLEELSA